MYDRRHYVRMVGLKLVLLALACGAMAAVVPVPGNESLADASWGGMKLIHLILGTAGAGASLFFLPQFSGLVLGRTVVCGILCAAVGTPFLVALFSKYVGEPITGAENVLALALGVGGVYIIPAAQAAWTAFRNDPWAFVDRLRGRSPTDRGGQS